MLHSNTRDSQLVLGSTHRRSDSATSSDSEVNLQKGGMRHKLTAKRQNKINLEPTAANTGLHNMKRKHELRTCDSGLAAKRLKALQTKLAEKQASEGTSKERSPSCDINACSTHISDDRRFLDQNLSTQHPYLIAEETKPEDELMEWEQIEDEKILSHIEEVRTQIQHNSGINLDDRKGADYGMNSIFSANERQQWFIVLDTNILISSLKYIEELRDTNFKVLGFPVLVIPWQVLQELDILKDRRGSTISSSLAAGARRAVSFLHSNFISEHPRIIGQTALDSVPEPFKIEVPDDAILQCCFLVAQRTYRVILLSNDKNLCNKAIVNGIKAYQTAEIQKELERFSPGSVDQVQTQSSSGNELPTGNTVDIPVLMDPLFTVKAVSTADSIFCKLKSLLRELLSKVVESEMYKVYDTSWKIIVVIKPPWTLSDTIICLQKHWIAVFSFVLPTRIQPTLEILKGFFGNVTQSGYSHSLHEIRTVLQASLHLCMGIQSNEYHNLVSRCLTDIKTLQKQCEEALSALPSTGHE
jgi:rRNA-processing protein FCF1